MIRGAGGFAAARPVGARSAAVVLGFWVATSMLGACRPTAAPEPPRWNLLVVLLDTLRADHVGTYGYGRDTTPHLDAFAAGGVVFTDNRSQASCTWPSVNSILTSRWPQRFWGREFGLMGIPEEVPTLAGILAAEGYANVAVSASSVVRATPSWANQEGGFGRGFAVFHEECESRDAGCVNRQAIGHLGLLRRPFFLYLHYMDTHGPYRPPEGWPRRFAGGGEGLADWVRQGEVRRLAASVYQGEALDYRPADLEHLIALYDDELAYFDHRFGELIAAVEARGLLDDTLIVFLSDHGESFLEHEHVTHCRSAYEPEIRVPLILRVPGLAAGGAPLKVERPVSNVDLVPTVLDYLGVDAAPFGFEGRSLRPLIEGAAAADDPPVFSAGEHLRSVTDGRFKLIEDLEGGTSARLFDLAADPGERRDVLADRRRDYARLAADLEAWLGEHEPGARTDEVRRRTDEAIERLRAVGYLQ